MTDGFSGADIAGYCKRAGSLGFEQKIHGQETAINRRLLTDLLDSTWPSMTGTDLKRFTRYREERL